MSKIYVMRYKKIELLYIDMIVIFYK